MLEDTTPDMSLNIKSRQMDDFVQQETSRKAEALGRSSQNVCLGRRGRKKTQGKGPEKESREK